VLLQNLGSQIFSSVDRLAVGRILGVEAVAYYSVATAIAVKLLQVVSSLSQGFMPNASEAMVAGDFHRLYRLFVRGTWVSGFISVSLAVITIILSKPFLQFWVGPEFTAHSLSMFRILIFAYAFIAITSPAYFIANGIGIPWINSIGTISGGIITIVLIFILGNIWALQGIAWANYGYLINIFVVLYVYYKLKLYIGSIRHYSIPPTG
jgi:O-antigen/teichoic acid export membrane protein